MSETTVIAQVIRYGEVSANGEIYAPGSIQIPDEFNNLVHDDAGVWVKVELGAIDE